MTRARDLADSADKDIAGTLTLDGLTVDGNGSLLTLDNGSNPATLSNTNGNVTLDFDTTNAGRNYTIQGNNLDVFRASNGGDISFYEDTGTTAKFFWDASAESLGIGTSAPDAPLVIEESAVSQVAQSNDIAVFKRNGAGYLKVYSPNTNIGGIAFGDPDDPFIGAIRYQHSTDHLDFYVNNAERMRIDSDGNLLVGKTSDNQALAGVKLGTGGSNMSRNNEVLVLNRLSTDGTILNLKKDGATVGSIGTQSGTLQIDGTSGSTGLLFGASNIYPRDNGANSDGGVDIGGSSIRFKDLYLSGGVYLGGTGSANKLTDYEHGFFTPTFGGTTTDPSGVTYDGTVGNEGFYVKVGRAVFIQINIRTDGITNVGDGTLLIKGLPFTSPDQTSQGGVATVAVSQSRDFAGENPSAAYITENATYITPFYRLTADGGSNLSQCSDLGTGLNDNLIRIGGTYYVTV